MDKSDAIKLVTLATQQGAIEKEIEIYEAQLEKIRKKIDQLNIQYTNKQSLIEALLNQS